MATARRREIHARRVRHLKLQKLREQHHHAKSPAEKRRIEERVGRIAPWLTTEKFMLMAHR